MKIQELIEAKYKYGKAKVEQSNRVTVIIDINSVPYQIREGPFATHVYIQAMEGLAKDIDTAGTQIGITMPRRIGYSGSRGFPEGRFKYNSNAIRDLIRTVVKATPGFSLKY